MAVIQPADMTERELTAQVVELAKGLGYLRYHTWRSKHSPAGFPDEVLVRDRVIYLELKAPGKKLQDAQKTWISALVKAHQEVYVIRPDDLQLLADVLGWEGPACRRARMSLNAALSAELG